MTVADDLATLRVLTTGHWTTRAALDRVEAELARLAESREKERRLVDEWTGEAATQRERAEAAETEAARLDAILTQTQDECTTLREEAARLRDGLRVAEDGAATPGKFIGRLPHIPKPQDGAA